MAQILLCGDNFHATLAGIRGLRAGGHVPYLAECCPRTYASSSRWTEATLKVPDPDFDPVGYATAVGEAGARIGVDAILPGSESSLVVLSRYSTAIPESIATGAPSESKVMTAVDKMSVVELAERTGFHTPPTLTATADELSPKARRLEYPLIIKPPRSKLPLDNEERMRHVRAERIETSDQLQRFLARVPQGPWVVQPYFDANLSAVGGVAWEGSLVCAVHQVARRIWPPDAGFSSYAETVPADNSVEETVERLLTQLGWSGIFQIQFIQTRDAKYFIDFNPRLYGSIALAIAAGQNLPAIWADLVLGRKPKLSSYRPGVRYRLENNDARAIRRLLATGAVSAAVRAVLPRRNTVHAIFSLRDPRPFCTLLTNAAGHARRLVKR
jgi:predicted ATP-grasp superfamily ATP-dependent carboligase